MSLPAWGVRVEIPAWFDRSISDWSLPAWGVRVEIEKRPDPWQFVLSLPAWGVRVEIKTVKGGIILYEVTPRMGSAG